MEEGEKEESWPIVSLPMVLHPWWQIVIPIRILHLLSVLLSRCGPSIWSIYVYLPTSSALLNDFFAMVSMLLPGFLLSAHGGLSVVGSWAEANWLLCSFHVSAFRFLAHLWCLRSEMLQCSSFSFLRATKWKETLLNYSPKSLLAVPEEISIYVLLGLKAGQCRSSWDVTEDGDRW